MKLTLPKPPTTNTYYAVTNRGPFARMYISKEGKDWGKAATEAIKKQYKKKSPIDSECEIWLTVYTSSARDADATTKPVLDILQTCGVILNDKLFYAVHAIREKCKKTEDRVEVEIMGY